MELVRGRGHFLSCCHRQTGQRGGLVPVGGNEGRQRKQMLLVRLGHGGGEHGLPFVVDQHRIGHKGDVRLSRQTMSAGPDGVGVANEAGFDRGRAHNPLAPLLSAPPPSPGRQTEPDALPGCSAPSPP